MFKSLIGSISTRSSLHEFLSGTRRTEARQCISDVLAKQEMLEKHLMLHPQRGSFEALVAASGIGRASFEKHTLSCGNTVRCWASLFLSQRQINDDALHQLISGGIFKQIWNNPNLICSFILFKLKHVLKPQTLDSEVDVRLHDFRAYRLDCHSRLSAAVLPMMRTFCCKGAFDAITALRTQLLRDEVSQQLPRVFFCHMLWTLEAQRQQCQAASVWDGIGGDHEMVIIKRLNKSADSKHTFEFQLVQGYQSSEVEPGYSVTEWQCSGRRFSMVEGFHASELEILLQLLCKYATNRVWCGDNHYKLCGIREVSYLQEKYLPAFSFRELTDETILGWGERPLSDHLMAKLQSWEQK
eukprot:gnl/MRDRNA2_/MRDRNA2_178586_c0_seq1.p1 gnl/MRDRNA2_/MRDRNA2_178586_c0~~gnl/MRDRNA2_/MRDRNA2_178586_c0_seq1.p1  ORF type:complete len:355 (+),score=56.31 gnl/MRDRNA2_/MRDRNA2_178586_c0_seq1:20-1084(+)